MSDLHPLYQFPEEMPEYLRLCTRIADMAHEGQTRKKPLAVNLPYATHLAATLNILERAGEENPVVLAAALLHDVLEDGDKNGYLSEQCKICGYPSDDEHKEKALEKLLESVLTGLPADQGVEQFGDSPGEFAHKVVGVVKELTGQGGLGDRKRILRCLAAQDYSPEAARIKIAELNASVADDIINRSMRDREEQRTYNDYAWAVAKTSLRAIKDKGIDDPIAVGLFKFMRYLHDEHRKLLGVTTELSEMDKEETRRTFDLDIDWDFAQQMEPWLNDIPAQEYISNPSRSAKDYGIVEVGLTDSGKVARAMFLLDPNATDGDERFYVINHFTKAIERKYLDNAIGYGRLRNDSEAGLPMLKIKLREPILLEDFLHHVRNTGGIDMQQGGHDQAFVQNIEREAQRLSEQLIEHQGARGAVKPGKGSAQGY